MVAIRTAVSVILAALGAAALPAQGPDRTGSSATVIAETSPTDPAEVVDRALPRMKELLRAGITTLEPSTNIWRRAGRETVFDGSYDWHSCIAAHWAALSMARVDGDAELQRFVLERLTPEVLECERALMNSPTAPQPTGDGGPVVRSAGGRDARAMFKPYADAWMVMLLSELARHDGRDTAALRVFRSECEARILDTLEAAPFPEFPPTQRRPEPAFCGSYRSWLFGYFVLRLCGTVGDGASARLGAVGSAKLDPQRAAIASRDTGAAYDFLDLRALLALVDRVEGAASTPVSGDAAPLPDAVTLRTVHVVGYRISTLWPLAFDAASDPAARAAFADRTAQLLRRTDLWADDFTVVSHWVPQFLWLGIWLSRGRP